MKFAEKAEGRAIVLFVRVCARTRVELGFIPRVSVSEDFCPIFSGSGSERTAALSGRQFVLPVSDPEKLIKLEVAT